MKTWICILLAFAAGAAHAGVRDYAYAWTISPQVGGPAYQVELTPEVYAALTTSDLRDFDVVNNAGESVPTGLYRPAAAAPRNPTVALPMFTVPAAPGETPSANDEAIHLHVERGPDGRLSSVDAAATPQNAQLDNRSKIILDASRLHTSLLSLHIDWDNGTDATAHFGVSASEDLQNWRSIVGNAAATRLTQDGNTLERHEIPLDRAPHAYLMLTRFDNGPALPHLQVSVTTPANPQQPEQRWIAADSDGLASADTSGATTFLYHLPAPLAASGANVQLADDNAIARAQLSYTPMLGPQSRYVTAAFVAFRLRDGDTLLSNDPLRGLNVQRAREWSVTFTTPVTHAPALSIAYTPDRIVFLPQGGQPYRLLAGSAKARHADAPIDVALAQWRASNGPDWNPPLVTLGARSEAGGERVLVAPRPAAVPPWRTWLLWGVLVAAAAIVGGLALSLLRKT